MAVQRRDQMSESLAERIAAHRAEMIRRREEGIDPLEELRAFVREHFDADSLLETYREYRDEKLSWIDRDNDAEDAR